MGRFIPRHRLKAGALALPYAPAASVGRSVTSRGTPDGQDRRTGRVRRSALPSPVAAVTAHRVALSEVPAHRAIDAKRPSRDCRSGGSSP